MSKKTIAIKSFEVRPVRENNGECEVAKDTKKADFWTLYGRLDDGTAEALEDFRDAVSAYAAAAHYSRCRDCVHLSGGGDGSEWRCMAADDSPVASISRCPEGLELDEVCLPDPSGGLVGVAVDTEGRYRVDVVPHESVSTGVYEDFGAKLKERQKEWRRGSSEADLAFFWVPTYADEGRPQWIAAALDADDAAEILVLAAAAERKSLEHTAFAVETADQDKGGVAGKSTVVVTERDFRFAGSFRGGGRWEIAPLPLDTIRVAFRPETLPCGFVGNLCPVCGSDDVEGWEVETGRVFAFQEMTCPSCGTSWTNRYEISGLFALDRGSTQ